MKMSKPNNLSQRSKSARGRALHYLRFGLSALLLQSSFALAEASESSENSADEALIEPCDPFTDSTCSNRVELGNGQAFEGRLKQGKPHGRGSIPMAIDLRGILISVLGRDAVPCSKRMAVCIRVFGCETVSTVR